MRLILQGTHEIGNSRSAKKKLQVWRRWGRRAAIKHPSLLFHPMVRCAGRIGRHLEGILAHVGHKTTNAFLGALTSVLPAAKRKAGESVSTDNRIAVLYFTDGKLRIPAGSIEIAKSTKQRAPTQFFPTLRL